jgi:YD repeat-containing protein
MALPSKISYAQDYWGYYNGKTNNTSMLPDIIPLTIGTAEFIDLPASILETTHKANRGPSAIHMQAGIITKVRFPTGGSKEFTFEPHKFSNFTFYDAADIAAGMTLSFSAYDLNSTGTSQKSTEIQMSSITVNATAKINFSKGMPGQNLDYDDIKDSRVYLKKQLADGSLQTLRTWLIPIELRLQFESQGKYEIVEQIILTPGQGIKYFIVADLPDALGQQGSPTQNAAAGGAITYYAPPTVTSSTKSYGGGLRISKISLKDEHDNIALVREFQYEKNGITQGKLLSTPKFLKFVSKRFTNVIQQTSHCPITLISDRDIFTVTSQSNISLALAPNSGFVGYSFVKVIEASADGNPASNGSTVYEFINNENTFGAEYPEDPWLDNGLPIRRTVFTKDNIKLMSTTSVYSVAPTTAKNIFGYILQDTHIGPNTCWIGTCLSNHTYTNRYKIRRYPIRTAFYKMDSSIDSVFTGANVMLSKDNYLYNESRLIKSKNSITTTGDLMTTEYLYGFDYGSPTNPFPDTTIQNMNVKFFYPIIEEKRLRNGVIQNATFKSYKYVGPQKYLPKSSTVKNATGSVFDFLHYPTYSSSTGNPQEFVDKSGVNTIILWGRNGTTPIAKIVGATMAAVTAKVNATTLETMTSVSNLRTELLKLFTITGSFTQLFFYDSKGQLVEIIDPRQQSTFFEYDAMGRFRLARDHNRNILSNYQYHFKGQPTPSSPY